MATPAAEDRAVGRYCGWRSRAFLSRFLWSSACPAAVLIDELDAGGFKTASYDVERGSAGHMCARL